MNSKIKAKLRKFFKSEEAKEIEEFLNKGFSLNGQIAIASIFLFANDYQKSVREALDECEKEWERNWQYQHPEIRGNADAPGGAGIQNIRSIENIYKALKIPYPLPIK